MPRKSLVVRSPPPLPQFIGRMAGDADMSASPAILPMNWGNGGGDRTTRDFLGMAYETYASPVTGRSEIRWLGTPKLYPGLPVILDQPGVNLIRPKAYWVPATKPEVIS